MSSIQAQVRQIARREVQIILRANDLQYPKRGKKILFANGQALSGPEMVQRRMAGRHAVRFHEIATRLEIAAARVADGRQV